jgi:nanoRNase/pAp phosphatase (c-di-AMP/oligoRNAs hydrolase)
MVDLCKLDLVPVEEAPSGPDTAYVMVDSQPRTGRRASEAVTPAVVLDHHETGGSLSGVAFRDIRPNVGATTTIVTGYLLEQEVPVGRLLATALYYGIDSEATGYPREATPADDGALVWLFPRADKDLLARIRNPRLPHSYFATVQHALANAFVYGDLLLTFCGEVPQPDIIAEVADFFIRYDRISWAVALGLHDGHLRLSARVGRLHEHSGDVLRAVVDGLGTAGGHDRRAGGAIPLKDPAQPAIQDLLRLIRQRLLTQLHIDDTEGRRLLEACPTVLIP